jgi:pyrroloquinoline quinone (PQQ) biosynthesis protein C
MIASRLDAVVARYDLNTHPFYQAWRAGTLPRAALAMYANEYAPFIRAIEQGWSVLGDDAHAAEERQHAALWDEFRDAFGSREGARCPEALALEAEFLRAFADRDAAIGALYAFEAQQPSTARSKLEGLRQHYALTGQPTRYFQLHADDYGERDRLRERMGSAAPAVVLSACERACRAMWSALDGILKTTGDGAMGEACAV